VLTSVAMREGSFYKFWVYIIVSRTGTLYIWCDWLPGSTNPTAQNRIH
jgi:hypothetical protein